MATKTVKTVTKKAAKKKVDKTAAIEPKISTDQRNGVVTLTPTENGLCIVVNERTGYTSEAVTLDEANILFAEQENDSPRVI